MEKPARYTGGELNAVVKPWDQVKVRVALAFPDIYEIGFSHLGLRLLYHLINEQKDYLAERVYAPATTWNRSKAHYPFLPWKPAEPAQLIDRLYLAIRIKLYKYLEYAEFGNTIKERRTGREDSLIIGGDPVA